MGEKRRRRDIAGAELDVDNATEPIEVNDDAIDDPQADAAPRPEEAQPAKKGKSAPVLPWMRVPVTIDASDGVLLDDVGGLDPRLHSALTETKIEVLFPVQSVVWRETSGGTSTRHDVCIAAPTGSGKTLAYSLPILQGLAHRTVPRLRALILLPTRDLALQVHGVLAGLCPALGLRLLAACGSISLEDEAAALVGFNDRGGSSSGVDIMVATPGRLMAHLSATPGFTLKHLQYLVIDETDRLLRQSYQGWLPRVMAALPAAGSGTCNNKRVVKMVVSATLTRDPSKLEKLQLCCPRYIAMSAEDHRYKLPSGLQEAKLIVPAEKKPCALAAVLQSQLKSPTIVFTSSLEATHRLYLMLSALPGIGPVTAEYSSSVAPAARKAALTKFRAGQTTILVSSDAMTRGMDLENVARVINYDAPVYVKTYVHRAGRAARANKTGSVLTLLRQEDVRHFKEILQKVDNAYVKDYELEGGRKAWEEESLREEVHAALGVMAEKLEEESAAARAAHGKERSGAGNKQIVRGTFRVIGQEQEQGRGGDEKKSGKKLKKRKLNGLPELSLQL